MTGVQTCALPICRKYTVPVVSCGLCQELCPCGAITMSEGRPAWSKPQCVRCLACLHRCPTKAIRWKSPGEDQGRYYNPRVEP